jgi:hypothetical protein
VAEGEAMDKPQHPKGALTCMLLYLVFITLVWINAYFPCRMPMST